jgi:hypothetical protein
MNGIAALAVKEVAVVSGFGSGLLAPSAVDGFAVGTLLSGVCLLMAIGPRRRLRRVRQVGITPSSRDGVSANSASARSDYSAATISGSLANKSAKVSAPADTSGRDEGAHANDSKNNGYRSRHRLSDPDASRRPESRRSAPRHAARAHRIGRMTSKLPSHPVPVRD